MFQRDRNGFLAESGAFKQVLGVGVAFDRVVCRLANVIIISRRCPFQSDNRAAYSVASLVISLKRNEKISVRRSVGAKIFFQNVLVVAANFRIFIRIQKVFVDLLKG